MPLASVPSSSSLLGEDHPVRDGPAKLGPLERAAVREHGAGKRDRHGRAGPEVPGAAHDLARLALPHVHPAELETVGVRVLAGLEDAADEVEGVVAVLVGDAAARDALHLARGDGEPLGELGRAGVHVDVLAQPGEGNLQRHALELAEEPEVVLPEHPQRRQAVAQHGDPLEADPEGEAASTPPGRSRRTRGRSGRPCPSRRARSSPTSGTRHSRAPRRGSRRRPARATAP